MASPSPPDATGSKSGFALQLAVGTPFQQDTLRGCFEGQAVGERTSTIPRDCCRWIAICRAGEVCEWSERINLRGAERGDGLTFDRDGCSTDKHDRGERKKREEPNHGSWNANSQCTFRVEWMPEFMYQEESGLSQPSDCEGYIVFSQGETVQPARARATA